MARCKRPEDQKKKKKKHQRLRNILINEALRFHKRSFEIAFVRYRYIYRTRYQKLMDRLPHTSEKGDSGDPNLDYNLLDMTPDQLEHVMIKYLVLFPRTFCRITKLSSSQIGSLYELYRTKL
jgi:hypothetical protein